MATKFRSAPLQKVYDDFIATDRDPTRPGRDGLAHGFHRGFMMPHRVCYPRTSLAYAAWAAGRDRRRNIERIARRNGIAINKTEDGFFWHTPGANLGDPSYREGDNVFDSPGKAWFDYSREVQNDSR